MSTEIDLDSSKLTATDKFYLDGGFGYDPKWAKSFIEERTSLANGSGRLLDLACGDGFWAFILAEWFDVTGEDLSPGGIFMARKKAREENLPVSFELIDSLETSDQYDVVFARGPSFWSNRSPDDDDFARGLDRVFQRVKEKLVYITYTDEPFGRHNEGQSSYYHDPEVLRSRFSAYGATTVELKDKYIVCEVEP